MRFSESSQILATGEALPITTARKKTITVANLVIDKLEVRDIAARKKKCSIDVSERVSFIFVNPDNGLQFIFPSASRKEFLPIFLEETPFQDPEEIT